LLEIWLIYQKVGSVVGIDDLRSKLRFLCIRAILGEAEVTLFEHVPLGHIALEDRHVLMGVLWAA
jgi:hypothetical protein